MTAIETSLSMHQLLASRDFSPLCNVVMMLLLFQKEIGRRTDVEKFSSLFEGTQDTKERKRKFLFVCALFLLQKLIKKYYLSSTVFIGILDLTG